jgi:hypothetical protein
MVLKLAHADFVPIFGVFYCVADTVLVVVTTLALGWNATAARAFLPREVSRIGEVL